MGKSNSRVEIIDQLRVVATLSVIFIHLSGWFMIADNTLREPYLFLANTSRFAVPMFVFISAVLFLLKYQNQKTDIKKYYQSRFKKIVLPYFIVSAIYYLYKLTPLVSPKIKLSFEGWTSLIDFMIKTFTIGAFSHLYFVPLIIMFYILAPFILTAYKKYKYFVIGGLVGANVAFLLTMLQLDAPRLYYRWTIFPYLIYVVLGFLFADNYKKIKNIRKEAILAILFIVIPVIVLIYGPYSNRTLVLWGFSSYIYDTLFGLFWILVFLLVKFPEKVNKTFTFLSKKSFGIYLFHYLLLDIFFGLIVKGFIDPPLNIFIYAVIIFFITVVSIMLYYMVGYLLNYERR